MWVTDYPSSALRRRPRRSTAPPVLNGHGGRHRRPVPEVRRTSAAACRRCLTSQWFECPCHGSQYNQVGEKKGGPAPAASTASPPTSPAASLTVDTGTIIQGPPIGTNTTGQEAEGPHCVWRRRTDAHLTVHAAQSPPRPCSHRLGRRAPPGRRLRGLGRRQHAAGQARGRLRDRAGAQPQAVPQRRGARGQASSTARSASACVAARRHRGRPAAVLARRAGPAGRRGRRLQRASSSTGQGDVRLRQPRRRASAARSATAPNGVGGVATTTRSLNADGDFVAQVNWKAPALNTVLLATPATRSATSSTTAGRSRRCRRGASLGGGPLTDQQLENLIDYLESIQLSPERRKKQLDRRDRRRSARAPRQARKDCTGDAQHRRGKSYETARRGAVQPGPLRRLRRRRLLVRPLPHQGLVLRRSRGRRRRCARPQPHRRSRSSSPAQPRRDQQIDFVCQGRSTASSTASTGRAPAACPASAVNPTPTDGASPRPHDHQGDPARA